MDPFIFEYRDFFLKRIQQIEPTIKVIGISENGESFRETPETSICARIRPLTENEREDNHIEAVLGHELGAVNIYEPKRKFNGKPEINSSTFTLDEIYGPDKSTEDIYSSRVNELVQWGLEGGTSMLLAYGQTGSGKTYTVAGLERLLVDKLIEVQASGKKEVRVCIFEVFGSRMFDLLNERNGLTVKEDVFGTMQLGGVFEKSPKTAAEFLELIDTAKSLRSTASTNKNDQSSRSHSICRIRIVDTESELTDEGNIMLVDLAGSEASSDTSQHSKERMIETREINKSLNVLKDCITKRAQWSVSKAEATQKHIHIPYRASKLTQVLKSAFDVNNTQTCKTIVIACIAPSILDVSHSKNTLRYAETLKVPIPKAKPMPFHEQIPITWSNKDVQDWISKNSGKPSVNPRLLAPKETGTQLCRLNEDEFVRRALLTKNVETKQAKLLFLKLWSLHIDSRALLNRPGDSDQKLDAIKLASKSNPKTNQVPKKVIKSGMFFKIQAEAKKADFEIVMTMGENRGKETGTWTCAAVYLRDSTSGAHELLVVKQDLIKTSALVDEVGLEYDSKTRYYYLKDAM